MPVDRYVVLPGSPLRASVRAPGDKSISHRALLLSALAEGRSTVSGANMGADALATARIVRGLGCDCEVDAAASRFQLESPGRRGLREPDDVLDAGNSGTTLRIMLGLAATLEGVSTFTGDASLRARPMLRVVAPLRRMGASIDGRRNGDLAPLTVRGGRLTGIRHGIEVASAQVKTALLLAGLGATGATSVVEPVGTRDHTERMLAAAGVAIERSGTEVKVSGEQVPHPMEWTVPGDISAALFLIVAALIVEGSDLTVEGVGLNPTRTGALEVLRRMGADIDVRVESTGAGEPAGSVRARSSELTATVIEGAEIAGVIDELPALAVAATQARGDTRVRDAGELRLKESDRIDAIVAGLSRLGVPTTATSDGFVVSGPRPLRSVEVDSCGDHRIAMALAVAGLAADGPVGITRWGCVETSFPRFAKVLERVTSGEARRRGGSVSR